MTSKAATETTMGEVRPFLRATPPGFSHLRHALSVFNDDESAEYENGSSDKRRRSITLDLLRGKYIERDCRNVVTLYWLISQIRKSHLIGHVIFAVDKVRFSSSFLNWFMDSEYLIKMLGGTLDASEVRIGGAALPFKYMPHIHTWLRLCIHLLEGKLDTLEEKLRKLCALRDFDSEYAAEIAKYLSAGLQSWLTQKLGPWHSRRKAERIRRFLIDSQIGHSSRIDDEVVLHFWRHMTGAASLGNMTEGREQDHEKAGDAVGTAPNEKSKKKADLKRYRNAAVAMIRYADALRLAEIEAKIEFAHDIVAEEADERGMERGARADELRGGWHLPEALRDEPRFSSYTAFADVVDSRPISPMFELRHDNKNPVKWIVGHAWTLLCEILGGPNEEEKKEVGQKSPKRGAQDVSKIGSDEEPLFMFLAHDRLAGRRRLQHQFMVTLLRVFIFDEIQIKMERNDYKSAPPENDVYRNSLASIRDLHPKLLDLAFAMLDGITAPTNSRAEQASRSDAATSLTLILLTQASPDIIARWKEAVGEVGVESLLAFYSHPASTPAERNERMALVASLRRRNTIDREGLRSEQRKQQVFIAQYADAAATVVDIIRQLGQAVTDLEAAITATGKSPEELLVDDTKIFFDVFDHLACQPR